MIFEISTNNDKDDNDNEYDLSKEKCTASYVKRKDDFVKNLIEKMLIKEKEILSKYKELKIMNMNNDKQDPSIIEELEKHRLFIKFKRESFEKQLVALMKLINYLNYLNKEDNDIDVIKGIINNIELKKVEYNDD